MTNAQVTTQVSSSEAKGSSEGTAKNAPRSLWLAEPFVVALIAVLPLCAHQFAFYRTLGYLHAFGLPRAFAEAGNTSVFFVCLWLVAIGIIRVLEIARAPSAVQRLRRSCATLSALMLAFVSFSTLASGISLANHVYAIAGWALAIAIQVLPPLVMFSEHRTYAAKLAAAEQLEAEIVGDARSIARYCGLRWLLALFVFGSCFAYSLGKQEALTQAAFPVVHHGSQQSVVVGKIDDTWLALECGKTCRNLGPGFRLVRIEHEWTDSPMTLEEIGPIKGVVQPQR